MAGISGFIDKVAGWIVGTTTFAVRRFVMFSMILFFIGMASGLSLAKSNMGADVGWVVVFLPLVLAFLAYLYTAIATIIFIFLLLGFIVLLLL
ncbi:MAG: hypothetical protein ACE5DI_02715 [Candidatus Micrarchaeia archaeon]